MPRDLFEVFTYWHKACASLWMSKFNTWMAWIWSSKCLALLCTSTHSSNLKWVSGGGINNPRHQTSHWLKAVESSTIGWSNPMFFRASVHPVLLAVSLHYTWLLTQLLQRYAPTLRRIIWCWRPCGQNLSSSFHATVGWTAAHPSVHPVLKASSWRVSVLFKLDHRIDRRFPPMDHRFIRHCYLRDSSSPIHLTQLGKGPSFHPMVSS
jgi:hypothetical protein